MKERSLLGGVQSPDMRTVAAMVSRDPLIEESPFPEACQACTHTSMTLSFRTK